MKKIKQSMRYKELIALVLIVLIYFLFRAVLSFVGAKLNETRETELIELKMNVITDIVAYGNEKRTAADASVSENLAMHIELMTNLLGEFVTEDGYTGPRVFSDGFVAEVQGERILIPAEYEKIGAKISLGLIEEGLQSGDVMTGRVIVEEVLEQGPSEEPLTGPCFFSFGKIAENIVYVDLMTESEYTEYLNRFSNNFLDMLKSADETFSAVTLLLQEQDGSLRYVRQYGSAEGIDFSAMEFTDELVGKETKTLTLGGQEYFCTSVQLVDRRSEGAPLYLVQLLPTVSLEEQNVESMRLLRLCMAILLLAVTVYTVSVQRYVADNSNNSEVMNYYQPKKMRKRMIGIGLLCVLITFAVGALTESLGLMYEELRYGKDALNLFSEQLKRETLDDHSEIREEEESWFVYYGEELGALLAEYPELNTAEKLSECCDILDIDYIMLFDSKGQQTLCSSDYSGFTLNDEDEPELYDFRRLLYGVPSIVHPSSVNSLTGLERQLIGVKMTDADKPGKHGALLMALSPERTGKVANALDATSHDVTYSRGTISLAANAETGEILFSSDAKMVGKLITDCGLPEKSLRDGFMDFTTIAGTEYLLITNRDGDIVYFYGARSNAMLERIVRGSALATMLFAVVLALLLVFLLRGYNEKAREEWTELREKSFQKKLPKKHAPTEDQDDADEEKEEKPTLGQRLSDILHWDQKRSSEKVLLIIRIGLIILILCALDLLNGKHLPNEGYDTMLGFLMNGDWMRGLNLFCLCSILLVISFAYLINIVCNLLLKLVGVVFAGKGETIWRLLYSCIRYITIFAVFYFTLEYLGFSTGTVIASLGVVSLALSLGAQDLIKDVLAGLAIVFEGSFGVGDIVDLDGKIGMVKEIGVRATRLSVAGNNTMIISNHDINKITNMSKELSEFRLEVRVRASESLPKIEELLNRELPEIAKKSKLFRKGPYLLGVNSYSGAALGSGAQVISLTVAATIREQDTIAVKLFLNREICLLFEREGIDLL